MAGNGRGAVLVTGASTGIGEASALRLAQLGFHVFAGVRRAEDGERVRGRATGTLTPVMLEVTDAASVAAAAVLVSDRVGEQGLAGLVNNAGIAVAGPLEFLPLDRVRRQFEVNVFGLLSVTQVMLPLIRKARGRIVNIGSASGLFAAPFVGAYAASKFAVEALTDSLRVELAPWGIHVIVVEPGAIATDVWARGRADADELEKVLPPAAFTLYGAAMKAVRAATAGMEKAAAPASSVTAAVEHALTSATPRTRYPVGLDARMQGLFVRFVPDRARDALVRLMLGTTGPGAG